MRDAEEGKGSSCFLVRRLRTNLSGGLGWCGGFGVCLAVGTAQSLLGQHRVKAEQRLRAQQRESVTKVK